MPQETFILKKNRSIISSIIDSWKFISIYYKIICKELSYTLLISSVLSSITFSIYIYIFKTILFPILITYQNSIPANTLNYLNNSFTWILLFFSFIPFVAGLTYWRIALFNFIENIESMGQVPNRKNFHLFQYKFKLILRNIIFHATIGIIFFFLLTIIITLYFLFNSYWMIILLIPLIYFFIPSTMKAELLFMINKTSLLQSLKTTTLGCRNTILTDSIIFLLVSIPIFFILFIGTTPLYMLIESVKQTLQSQLLYNINQIPNNSNILAWSFVTGILTSIIWFLCYGFYYLVLSLKYIFSE